MGSATFRVLRGAGRGNVGSENASRVRSLMAASDLQFLIIDDVKDGYRWWLRFARGETLDFFWARTPAQE